MQIHRLSLIEGAKQARGLTVVVDVFRAFSCAAYCFARGAQDIVLVSDVRDAFALKQKFPEAILIGEVGGRPIAGFDFGNSPTHIAETTRDFGGKRVVQRTSAGTQGVVNASAADELVLGSFVCAGAIAHYIQTMKPNVVSIVAMGDSGVAKTDEDEAFAELLEARLRGENADGAAFIQKAHMARALKHFEENTPDAPYTDVNYCLQLDKFDFVMTVAREDGLLVARRTQWV